MSKVEPHIEFLIVLLIGLEVFACKVKHCIRWVGMDDNTDFANVVLPAMVSVLAFQLASLLESLLRNGLKLECLGEFESNGKYK